MRTKNHRRLKRMQRKGIRREVRDFRISCLNVLAAHDELHDKEQATLEVPSYHRTHTDWLVRACIGVGLIRRVRINKSKIGFQYGGILGRRLLEIPSLSRCRHRVTEHLHTLTDWEWDKQYANGFPLNWLGVVRLAEHLQNPPACPLR